MTCMMTIPSNSSNNPRQWIILSNTFHIRYTPEKSNIVTIPYPYMRDLDVSMLMISYRQ